MQQESHGGGTAQAALYIARNYHFWEKEPQTNVEWFEVMQHHGVKTRMLTGLNPQCIH